MRARTSLPTAVPLAPKHMQTPPPVTLLEELGRGSTAVVWRAALTEPIAALPAATEVACKRYLDAPEARACYVREAEIGATISVYIGFFVDCAMIV